MKEKIVIIGAGVIGCAIARELSKFNLSITVLEKNDDVCQGTSKANSGIIHAGYAQKPNTLKTKYNVLGSPLFDQVCKDLHVKYRRTGSFVVSLTEEGISELEKLKQQGDEYGVPTEIICDVKKILIMEPNLNPEVKAVLYAPSAGIISPYGLTIGLAENASINGGRFYFNNPVVNIEKNGSKFLITSPEKEFEADIIINCAGLYADTISGLMGLNYFKILPRRGEYLLFDKDLFKMNLVLFSLPTKVSKGVLVGPTVGGPVFLGPNAEDIQDKEDISVTSQGMRYIMDEGVKMVPKIPLKQVIASFAGIRASANTGDFIIERTEIDGFINVAGIQSPGLASSLAIANRVRELVDECGANLKPKLRFNPKRKKSIVFADCSYKEKDELIKKNPQFAQIVCRCETVTEAEIRDAIRRPIGAKSLDGIKFRTRAGMGRCQGGFCTARLIYILSEELNVPMETLTKKGSDSKLFVGKTKDLLLKEEIK